MSLERGGRHTSPDYWSRMLIVCCNQACVDLGLCSGLDQLLDQQSVSVNCAQYLVCAWVSIVPTVQVLL